MPEAASQVIRRRSRRTTVALACCSLNGQRFLPDDVVQEPSAQRSGKRQSVITEYFDTPREASLPQLRALSISRRVVCPEAKMMGLVVQNRIGIRADLPPRVMATVLQTPAGLAKCPDEFCRTSGAQNIAPP